MFWSSATPHNRHDLLHNIFFVDIKIFKLAEFIYSLPPKQVPLVLYLVSRRWWWTGVSAAAEGDTEDGRISWWCCVRFGPLRRPECPQMFPVPPRANSVNMQITDCRNPFMCLSVSVFFFSRSSYKMLLYSGCAAEVNFHALKLFQSFR